MLKNNVKNCLDYCKSLNNDSEATDLQTMLNLLNQDYLECLRVSDFNTTGLIGVDTNKTDSPFFYLLKDLVVLINMMVRPVLKGLVNMPLLQLVI